ISTASHASGLDRHEPLPSRPGAASGATSVATAEDFVPPPILQDHFEAAPVIHVRRSHALNVLSCRRHGSGHQVSLCQRVPLIATGADDVVDEEQGSCPTKFYRRTVTVRAGREEAASV